MRFFILLMLIPVISACTPFSPNASVNVEQDLFKSRQWNLAIINFSYTPLEGKHTSGVVTSQSAGPDAGKSVASLVANEISKLDNIRIIERTQINDLIEEQKLQMSGLVDTKTAVEVGKITGANAVLIGSVSEYVNWSSLGIPGNTVSFSMRMIDVESGRVITSGSVSHIDRLNFTTAFQNAQNLAQEIVEEISEE